MKTIFSIKNIALLTVVAALAFFFFGGWDYVKSLFLSGVPTTLENEFIQIPTGSNYDDVLDILTQNGIVEDAAAFTFLAEKMNYKKPSMRPGRFKIQPGWSMKQLVGHLRNGEQATVKVVLNNERLLEEVAGKLARFVEADSASFIAAFLDKNRLDSLGYTPETLMTLFIPNTYEMFWTTSPTQFLARMKKEHEAFWSKNGRLEKAKAQNLTPKEAYTLASIVERETNYNPEKRAIAGVYLNRLKIGMKLQADPTAVFATRDFGARRVLQIHTFFDSPFNTYMYAGLPPGPISMAGIPSIEAVLNPEPHKYLYFCAKADESGTHAFAETLPAHNQNAARFQAWMRTKGIR